MVWRPLLFMWWVVRILFRRDHSSAPCLQVISIIENSSHCQCISKRSVSITTISRGPHCWIQNISWYDSHYHHLILHHILEGQFFGLYSYRSTVTVLQHATSMIKNTVFKISPKTEEVTRPIFPLCTKDLMSIIHQEQSPLWSDNGLRKVKTSLIETFIKCQTVHSRACSNCRFHDNTLVKQTKYKK